MKVKTCLFRTVMIIRFYSYSNSFVKTLLKILRLYPIDLCVRPQNQKTKKFNEVLKDLCLFNIIVSTFCILFMTTQLTPFQYILIDYRCGFSMNEIEFLRFLPGYASKLFIIIC